MSDPPLPLRAAATAESSAAHSLARPNSLLI
jgi:hypothetical protein